jgi:predicted nucleotide-binding protein
MARSGPSQPDTPTPAMLTRPRAEVEKRLRERIAQGKAVQNKPRNNNNDLTRYIVETQKWRDYNLTLLKTCFADRSFRAEYETSTYGSYVAFGAHAFMEIPQIEGSVGQQIAMLESILDRLELLDAASDALATSTAFDLSKVFVVHGHDGTPKAEVARFIEKLGFEAIILHERPNKGRALITKFREEAAGVGFAVVLMTPDDLGKAEKSIDLNPRARQNVVFELGFFIGKIGPERVAALVKGNIELPSDFDGVVYISLDKQDWKTKLGTELKTAGYEIDWNKVHE